jgi:hypothetical protein
VDSGEEEDDREEKREKEGGGENYHMSICNIEHAAHELMAAASCWIPPLSQDFLEVHEKGCARDLFLKEQNMMAKVFIENLAHSVKVQCS